MSTKKSYARPAKHPYGRAARMNRINAEFRRGYDLLSTLERAVTYFGSARTAEHEKPYREARKLSRLLATDGFTAVTGGGPGIMEAANRGAVEGGGRSVGFNIKLKKQERRNPYVQESVSFYYFFPRKVMLASAGHAYVFFPGGFGTLDEFFEITTLITTRKLHRDVPVVLIGQRYWDPLVHWLKDTVVRRYHAITPADLHLWRTFDTAEEAYEFLTGCDLKKQLCHLIEAPLTPRMLREHHPLKRTRKKGV